VYSKTVCNLLRLSVTKQVCPAKFAFIAVIFFKFKLAQFILIFRKLH
jgi:hypothetical protein